MNTIALGLLASLPLVLAAPADGAAAEEERGITVDALSRGAGVPDETRAAFDRIRGLLEAARRDGRVLRLDEETIGLEGERRLCAVPRDRDAARELLASLRDAARGALLLNVAERPCVGDRPKKGAS